MNARNAWNKFLARLEFGDLLLAFYFAIIVRQYLWWSGFSDPLAWSLSCLGALLLGYGYVITKEWSAPKTSHSFWLIVALPLFVVYAARVVHADFSFDVMNYRLVHGERSLSGFLFQAGDFFPTPAPYNPAPDMVTGAARFLLGYRLGTLPSLLAMIWVGSILDKMLRPHFANERLRLIAVLLVLLAEHLLFEINTYLIDLLALPLLLEATWLCLRTSQTERMVTHLARIAFLLGLSVAFKLTNLPLAIPIVLFCAYDFLRQRPLRPALFLKATLLSLGAFLATLVPFHLYSQLDTGSPVFPIRNGFFKSAYWGAHNGWDDRWGPQNFGEILLWPFRIIFVPERLSELNVYSGRISLGLICALVALLVARREKDLRALSLITVGGLLLWSATTGYIRYALYLELLAGVVVILLAGSIVGQVGRLPSLTRIAVAALLWLAMLGQAALACYYTKGPDWSGRSPFHLPTWRKEARYLLRDHSLRKFLKPADLALFDAADGWLDTSMKTNGIVVLLSDAPIIGLRNGENFVTPISRARYADSLDQLAGKRLFSLSFVEDLESALSLVRSKGFEVVEQYPLSLPFYSPNRGVGLVLIEVIGAERAAEAARKGPQ